jgi:trigger factor
MAEAETATAVQEDDYTYNVKVEDAGPATKKVSVEIPQDRIQSVLEKQYRELKREAAVPGFRAGRAPRKLIERRFSASIKEEVRRQLISESYQQALEKNNLQPLGEPEFDNPDAIQLPDTGALSYAFSVEVQPDIQLPDMANLTVKKPKIAVTDANVDQAMNNLREQQGTLVPVEDRGVEDKDYIVADVHVKLNGEVVAHQHDAQLIARAGRIAGIQIEDLADKLRGAKGGESRTFTVHAPDTHQDERIRDKDVEIEVAVKDIKKLELVEVNQEFLDSLGFGNEQELRDALREQLEQRIESDVQNAMRQQVQKFLLDNVQIELPAKLSERQSDRVVQRRAMDLMMRGMPREQIEQNIEQIKAGAGEEAQQELKLFFILQKVSTDLNVDVDEAELNGRIAMLAAQRGRRPEKMKQEMSKDGSLANMYVQMREQKALDELLKSAKVEEVEPEQAK